MQPIHKGMTCRRHVGGSAAGLMLGLCAVLVGGCGGTTLPVRTQMVPYTQEQELVRAESENASYRIRTGDRLKLVFKYEDELNQENIIVLPDGRVNLAGLQHSVKAAGTTVDDLNDYLTKLYGKDYRSPELSVIVQEITKPEVYVLGEVKEPGLYKMPNEGVGVIQAVAMAGGFGDDAKKSETVVMRATEEGFMIRSVDLKHLEKVGFQDLALFDLQPYDVIYVPRSSLGDFAYVTTTIFGSAINVTRFFWDIYALGNLNKIDRIVR